MNRMEMKIIIINASKKHNIQYKVYNRKDGYSVCHITDIDDKHYFINNEHQFEARRKVNELFMEVNKVENAE